MAAFNSHLLTEVPSKGLFLGDLSFFCTEMDLIPLFNPFGKIVNVEIKRGRHGDSLMHGFVDFEKEHDAAKARATLSGVKLLGRKLRINFTNTKVDSPKDMQRWIQVHVNFVSTNANAMVTEEFLDNIFQPFGNVADISVKRHTHTPGLQAQVSGYAFVFFLEGDSAMRAVAQIRGKTLLGVVFDCSFSGSATSSPNSMMSSGFPMNKMSPRGQHRGGLAPAAINGGFQDRRMMMENYAAAAVPLPTHFRQHLPSPAVFQQHGFAESKSSSSVSPPYLTHSVPTQSHALSPPPSSLNNNNNNNMNNNKTTMANQGGSFQAWQVQQFLVQQQERRREHAALAAYKTGMDAEEMNRKLMAENQMLREQQQRLLLQQQHQQQQQMVMTQKQPPSLTTWTSNPESVSFDHHSGMASLHSSSASSTSPTATLDYPSFNKPTNNNHHYYQQPRSVTAANLNAFPVRNDEHVTFISI